MPRNPLRATLLLLTCLAMAAPFLWMAVTSLMSQLEVFAGGGILPAAPLWSNYPEALTAQPFGRYFVNSLVFSVAVVAGQIVTATTRRVRLRPHRLFPGGRRSSCSFWPP